MKRVVVFGTVHQFQSDGHFLNDAFGRRLSYLIEHLSATLIMEEWSEKCPTSFAKKYAAKRQIAYRNVGTSSEKEEFQTFVFAQINHPGHDGILPTDEEGPPLVEYGPLDKQENRERKMIQNIQSEMESQDIGLFIVGLAHLHSVSAKLKAAGFDVAAFIWNEIATTTSNAM
jgi:hypothetical protein